MDHAAKKTMPLRCLISAVEKSPGFLPAASKITGNVEMDWMSVIGMVTIAMRKSKIEPAPIWGLYQPDAIATMEADGQIYLLTADEGDPRDYRGHSEVKNAGTTKIPNAISEQDQERLSRLEVSVSKVDRSQYPDRLLSFGGRSFSIRSTDGTLIFDSGDRLERELARRWPAHFNSNHDRLVEMDDRSRKRGPEPEGITVGKVGDRTLAFIALERASVIAVYDVTDPTRPALLNMVSGRESSQSKADAANKQDLGPETMAFIPACHSPTGKPLLLVAFEVSGTTRLYEGAWWWAALIVLSCDAPADPVSMSECNASREGKHLDGTGHSDLGTLPSSANC